MLKNQATAEIQRQIDQIDEVAAAGRRSPRFAGWQRETGVVIGHVFGNSHENVNHFGAISYVPSRYGSRASAEVFERRFLEGLATARAVLESMISEITRFWPEAGPARDARAPHEPSPQTTEDYRADVVIVCALHRPELEKIFQVSAVAWNRVPPDAADPHTYHRTTLQGQDGAQIQAVAAAPNHMGLAAAGVLATKLIWRFRPRLVAMVGIAAGVRRDSQGFGDVIAADQTFDYGAGKLSDTADGVAFLPDPRPLPLGTRALSRLKDWQSRRAELDDIALAWPAKKPATQLNLHVGPMASGAAVLNAQQPVDEILRHWRKTAGVEMEAFAVHSACREAIEPEPVFLCFKSVCDFVTSKTDDWQDFAAFTAASLALRFVTAEFATLCR